MTTTKSIPDLPAIQTAQAEAFLAMNDAVFGVGAKLVALNLETSRSLCKLGAAGALGIYREGWQNLAAAPTPLEGGKPMERTLTYVRNVCDIAAQTQTDMSELMESCVTEINDLTCTALDEIGETSPATASTAAAFKKAVTAFGNANKAMIDRTRQVNPRLMLDALTASEAGKAMGVAASSLKTARKAA